MAYDANKLVSSVAKTGGAVPLIYGQAVEKALYDAEQLKFLDNDITSLAQGAGDSIQVPIESSRFSVSALTEGTITPVSSRSLNKKTMTFAWYGDAKQWTVESDAVMFKYVLGRDKEQAGSAIGENRDIQRLTAMATTSSDAIYPYATSTTHYTSANIVATAVLSYEQITAAQTTMVMNRLKMGYVIASPMCLHSLKADTRVLNNNNYNKDVMEKGILKTLTGIQIVPHNAVASVTENSQTVYVNYAVVAKPIYFAMKASPVYEIFKENPRERLWTFLYYESIGVLKGRDSGIIPLKAVGAVL